MPNNDPIVFTRESAPPWARIAAGCRKARQTQQVRTRKGS